MILRLPPGGRLLAIAAALLSGAIARGDPSLDAVEAPTFVGAEWISDRGADDLGSALSLLPGGSLYRRSAEAELLLDGWEARRWAVEVDGVRLLPVWRGGVHPGAVPLPLYLGERVAVRHGPVPTLHGPGALVGAVDVQRGPPLQSGTAQAAVEGRGGGRNARRAAIATRAEQGMSEVDLAAFGAVDSSDPGTTASPALERSRAGVRARVASSLGPQAELRGTALLLTSELPGGALSQRSLFGFGAAVRLAPSQELHFRIDRQSAQEELNTAGKVPQRGAVSATAFEARYFGELIEGHRFDCSLTARVEDGQFSWWGAMSSLTRTAAGIAIVDLWRVSDRLLVLGHASLDVYDDVGVSTDGRVSVRYLPTDVIALRGTAGSAHRAPGLDERAALSAGGSRRGALLSERSQGLRVSAGLEPAFDRYVRVGLFRSDLEELIEVAELNEGQIVGDVLVRNRGRGHVWGLEVDGRAARLGAGFEVRAGYRWNAEARDDRTGRLLRGPPAHILSLRTVWDVALTRTRLFVDADLIEERAALRIEDLHPVAVLNTGVRQRLFEVVELQLAVDNAAWARGTARLPGIEPTVRVAVRLLGPGG